MTLARVIDGTVQGISLEFPWKAKQHLKGLRGTAPNGPYPMAQRRLVWKKLARLWWQRRHHDQESSKV
jgi:hypothetical protein